MAMKISVTTLLVLIVFLSTLLIFSVFGPKKRTRLGNVLGAFNPDSPDQITDDLNNLGALDTDDNLKLNKIDDEDLEDDEEEDDDRKSSKKMNKKFGRKFATTAAPSKSKKNKKNSSEQPNSPNDQTINKKDSKKKPKKNKKIKVDDDLEEVIPKWVIKYNLTSYFDWTWHKNGDHKKFLNKIKQIQSDPNYLSSNLVVNDALAYFNQQSNSDVGFIVDNFAQLRNQVPHPLPHSPDFRGSACKDLNIDSQWLACKISPEELSTSMPSTSRFVSIGIYNGFIDYGSCHPVVPGAIFNNRATFHFQRWTNNDCHNKAINMIRPVKSYDAVLSPIGTYTSAFGHFPNQQFPRLLRLLATVPEDTKVLLPTDGIAGSLVDIMVDRGIITRDRIIPFSDSQTVHGKVVYRSEAWPYLDGDKYGHYLHDRTDMELVHNAMVDDLEDDQRTSIVIVKRDGARALSNHNDVVNLVESLLPANSNLKVNIFLAQGHLRDHIDFFRKAKVVIAPHGAGLINVMWCKKGTHVVEIGYHSGMTLPSMYYEMSTHSGHDYYLVRGQGDYAGSISTNMEDLRWAVQQIFKSLEGEGTS